MPAGTEITLTLINEGRMSHNLHLPSVGVQTRTIAPGERDTVRFVARDGGSLNFRCEVPGHAEAGMTGVLRINNAP